MLTCCPENKEENLPLWLSQNIDSAKVDLGQYMIFKIDTDRLVKPTTNNPQSSRSHVLAMVKLWKDGGTPLYMFIGDFAGVENRFDMNNVEVLKQFYQVEMNHSYVKPEIDGKLPRYYSKVWPENWRYEGVSIDPIGSWEHTTKGGGKENNGYWANTFDESTVVEVSDGKIIRSSNDPYPYTKEPKEDFESGSYIQFSMTTTQVSLAEKFFQKDQQVLVTEGSTSQRGTFVTSSPNQIDMGV